MSLNNIQLSTHQLADLYSQVLVETTATAMPEEQTPLFHSLGGNAKNILVVVAEEKESFLPDSELTFLTSILTACKLNLADIALVNFEKVEQKDYKALVQYFNSRVVLLFNVSPLQFGLPINFPHFQIQEFNKCTYLFAPELRLVESDKQLKKELWTALKNIFGL
jgi:hypothetical protein